METHNIVRERGALTLKKHNKLLLVLADGVYLFQIPSVYIKGK